MINLYNAGNIRKTLPDKQTVQDFLQDIISYVEVAEGIVTKIAFKPCGEKSITKLFITPVSKSSLKELLLKFPKR